MMKRTLACLLLAVMGVGTSIAGDSELQIAVSPMTAFAPVDLTVRTMIQADRDNRAVEVVAESMTFYRSSEIQLDGDRAPRTTTVQFRSLPAGVYEVRVTLLGSRGEARSVARRLLTIMPRGGEGDLGN